MEYECKHLDLIQDIKKDLYGNAKKGLKDEVTTMKAKVNFILIGVGFIITQLSVLIIYLIKTKLGG